MKATKWYHFYFGSFCISCGEWFFWSWQQQKHFYLDRGDGVPCCGNRNR